MGWTGTLTVIMIDLSLFIDWMPRPADGQTKIAIRLRHATTA